MSRILYFLFNDTSTTQIYTLSLHDALPISSGMSEYFRIYANTVDGHLSNRTVCVDGGPGKWEMVSPKLIISGALDRKSTRLNSSHSSISYAVFCLKKKKKFRT